MRPKAERRQKQQPSGCLWWRLIRLLLFFFLRREFVCCTLPISCQQQPDRSVLLRALLHVHGTSEVMWLFTELVCSGCVAAGLVSTGIYNNFKKVLLKEPGPGSYTGSSPGSFPCSLPGSLRGSSLGSFPALKTMCFVVIRAALAKANNRPHRILRFQQRWTTRCL